MTLHKQLIHSPSDEASWRTELPAGKSVFGSLEFALLAARHFGVSPRLLVMHFDHAPVVYPFFLRPLDKLAFHHAVTGWDAVTPEFTGPFGLTDAAATQFSESLSSAFRELGAVTEFMHLHPWDIEAGLLQNGVVKFNREVVWVDVTLSTDDLWENHFSYACRKNIRRSQAEKVCVFQASTAGDIKEFHRIYRLTMDRNQALSTYYFPLEYFSDIFETLPAHSRFVMAESAGQVIAATLYMYDEQNVYSYLGGADYAFQSMRPTNAIVYETIDWARRAGKRRLILGGGYRPDDGIFKFKASFSSLRKPFYTYQRVHLPEQYAQLEHGWRQHFGGSAEQVAYFPSYRTAAPSKVEAENLCDASN
jgi:serine/alanine adding enzyme